MKTTSKTAPAAKRYSAPGRHERKRLTLVDLARMFPDDKTAGRGSLGFAGPVEVDETYVGGKASRMHARVRRERIHGRGAVDKTPVVGVKNATRVMSPLAWWPIRPGRPCGDSSRIAPRAGAMVYSDDARAYRGLPRHQAVKHSVAEHVNGQAHVNGIESFWAGLKRGYHGTFHDVSAEHLDRYVREFAGRHNRRGLDTEAMMGGWCVAWSAAACPTPT